MSNEKETIDLTPTPRILRMLGRIDFTIVQCLSELIDNSIDSFTDIPKGSGERFIKIRVPKDIKKITEDDEILVADNGSGMDKEALNSSLKAGFSGNGPIDKMGLFGMGFNVATARLGERTEIETTRKDDKFIFKSVIDFRELEKEGGNYQTPLEQIEKKADQIGKHWTKVRISKLNVDQVAKTKKRKHIVDNIGRIYGRSIRDKKIEIYYDGVKCKPFQHCVWSEIRTGENKGKSIPAILKINHDLGKNRYCESCWVWLTNSDPHCPSCQNNEAVTERKKVIKGWIGIQRYFHRENYGIDLIRNGRVIKVFDKSFFYVLDDNEKPELEYPIDGQQRLGRIVGELEIDFVDVTHQKDAFETGSREWKEVIGIVRGDGPIRPAIAKQRNYAVNDTPLAQLFSAFRNAKAGRKNLIPKKPNGGAMITDSVIQNYKEKFYNGEEGYQDDTKWWELIQKGERGSESEEKEPNTDNIDDIDDIEPNDDKTELIDHREEEDTENSAHIRCEHLSGIYSLDIFDDVSLKVEAVKVNEGSHEKGFLVDNTKGAVMGFKYWPLSKIYSETFFLPEDFLINELAYKFFVAADAKIADTPFSWIEKSIRKKHFPYLQPDNEQLKEYLSSLKDDIITHLRNFISSLEKFETSFLSENKLASVRRQMSQSDYLDQQDIENAIMKGEFLNYADLSLLREIFLHYPTSLFDGKFFARKLLNIESDQNEQLLVADVKASLDDLCWFEEQKKLGHSSIWRGRIRRVTGAFELIEFWRRNR